MTPGEKIRQAREDLGLTIEQACAATGGVLAISTWSRAETGVSASPNPRTKAAIAEILGGRVRDIWATTRKRAPTIDLEALTKEAERIEREGSLRERQRYAGRLYPILLRIDPRVRRDGVGDGRHEKLWRLVRSLAFSPDKTPLTIADGKMTHREIDGFTPATRARVLAATSQRREAQQERLKLGRQQSSTPVAGRTRPRERRDTARSSSTRGSPSDDPEEHKHGNSRSQKQAAR